jgi:hypothetical protein
MSAKRALTRFRGPDEGSAEERAWVVVRAAYVERVPPVRRKPYGRTALAFAGVVLLAALALSPAGATVKRLVTRALGVQHASPALVSLPSPGRMLASGPGGTWTVAADGATRHLGPWTQASWSPHGLYLTVASGDRLAAVDPRGSAKWTLARAAVSDPEWYPPSGYRVAYLSGDDLRVVAGDGTGDHLLAARVAHVAPAWRPGHPYQLAYAGAGAGIGGRITVRDGDTGQVLWSARPGATLDQLAWSTDGQRLLAVSRSAVFVYSANGASGRSIALPPGAVALNAALSPDGHTLALVLGGRDSEVVLEDVALPNPHLRRVLSGSGLRQVSWSPDGSWLLVSWPAANQWVFVRVAGAPRISAVSRIAQQFSAGGGHGFPQLEGWCCSGDGAAR